MQILRTVKQAKVLKLYSAFVRSAVHALYPKVPR